MERIKIGITDDNKRLLESLRENMSLFPDIELCWSAEGGKETIEKVATAPVDLILMDIEMPGMDGIEATRIIKQQHSSIKIIMLTVFDNNDKIFDAILAGASGYLLKDSMPQKIYQAMVEAQEGGAPMSPTIATKALQLINSMHSRASTKGAPVTDYLSEREAQILQHIINGLNYQEIAELLFISPKTVRNHIQNIYQKLQVTTKAEVINLSHKNNWFK